MNAQAISSSDQLLEAFAATDSLEMFRRLPIADQDEFFSWVERATTQESRWRRIDALALAMRISCLHIKDRLNFVSEFIRGDDPLSVPFKPATAPAVGELLSDLNDPSLFDILERIIDEFLFSRDDASVEETLAISESFLSALREAGCLQQFVLLPISDQARFLRWIGSTTSVSFRSKRIESFVSALKASSLDLGN